MKSISFTKQSNLFLHFFRMLKRVSRSFGTSQPSQTPKEPTAIVRVPIPFTDGQESANDVKKELKNLSIKLQTTVQPVFVSRKMDQDFKVRETKSHRSSTNNASFIVFNVTCVMCVMWAIRADTYTHVWMDINKRYLQYINTTTNSTAKSRKTY